LHPGLHQLNSKITFANQLTGQPVRPNPGETRPALGGAVCFNSVGSFRMASRAHRAGKALNLSGLFLLVALGCGKFFPNLHYKS